MKNAVRAHDGIAYFLPTVSRFQAACNPKPTTFETSLEEKTLPSVGDTVVHPLTMSLANAHILWMASAGVRGAEGRSISLEGLTGAAQEPAPTATSLGAVSKFRVAFLSFVKIHKKSKAGLLWPPIDTPIDT